MSLKGIKRNAFAQTKLSVFTLKKIFSFWTLYILNCEAFDEKLNCSQLYYNVMSTVRWCCKQRSSAKEILPLLPAERTWTWMSRQCHPRWFHPEEKESKIKQHKYKILCLKMSISVCTPYVTTALNTHLISQISRDLIIHFSAMHQRGKKKNEHESSNSCAKLNPRMDIKKQQIKWK